MPSRFCNGLLFKGGDLENVNNYRPISVLPVLSKVIERHVHDTLYYPKQSGFRKRHTTETALIEIIDELLFNLDNDRVSGMILIDYCKAFDKKLGLPNSVFITSGIYIRLFIQAVLFAETSNIVMKIADTAKVRPWGCRP